MAQAVDIQRVNGKPYDPNNLILKIDGDRYDNWKSFKFSQKRERGKLIPMNRVRLPIGNTRGKYGAEDIAWNAYCETIQELCDRLAQKQGGTSYGDRVFPITLQIAEPGKTTLNYEFFACQVTSDGGGGDDNVDPLYEDMAFSVNKIHRNGKHLY